MANKIAFISGATGGIGFQVAKRLGKDGYTIILNGIEDKAGVTRVGELQAEGIEAEYYGFDVTDEYAVTSNITAIGQKFGKIDVVVNNAGGLGGRCSIEGMSTEFYRSVMALNLDSVFFVSRAAIPFLKQSDNASIINFTSNAAWSSGEPGTAIYSTAKAAVHSFTHALAKELAPANIRVNSISPDVIDASVHEQIKELTPEVFASYTNNILFGWPTKQEELASVISFLVSEDASSVTAETLQIRAGQ